MLVLVLVLVSVFFLVVARGGGGLMTVKIFCRRLIVRIARIGFGLFVLDSMSAFMIM